MWYFILTTIGVILFIATSSSNKKVKESRNIIDSLIKEKEALKRETNKLNDKIDNYLEEIKGKNIEIDKLKSTVMKLDEELETYTEIKRDSLNLNVYDDEPLDKKITNNNSEADNGEENNQDDINQEKKKLFNIMNNSNRNLFITGKAGTGKSYLLKYFRKHTKKNVLYTAPTGIAALNINGVTLHSVFGFDNLKDEAIIKLSSNKKQMLKKIDTLIIDEISMVRVDVFNQIDKILKYVCDNNRPFGGKQVILFGDLFQLPPVVKTDEKKGLEDKFGGVFFFNSEAYKKGNFGFSELEEIFRQSDENFINILNDIREGKTTSEDIKNLNKRHNQTIPKRAVQIVPKKDEANRINEDNLNKLGGKEYTYEAETLFGKTTEADFPCDYELKLKVGALVMLIANDQEKRWVNGILGIVSKLKENEITITIDGKDYKIERYTFNKYRCEYDEEKKKLEYIVEASISQFPVILSYAITIHKSQGQTYQQIICNLDNCFAPGQAYVALSRCANFDKLFITNEVTPASIITDKNVVDYYLEMKKNQI